VERTLAPRIEAIRARADALAAVLAATAHASTTVGVERATLRLLGVQGLDRAGVPLAASVVERAIGDDPERLSHGIQLPFVAAVVLYDSPPADIALDVADGTIDLDLEAEALLDPGRRALIEAEAARLVGAALARVEANRTARRELSDMLGDAGDPLIGVRLRAARIDASGDEALALAEVTDRIDLLLTDMRMPGLQGRRLAEILSQSRPGMPVVFMTGFDEDTARGGLQRPADARIVTKPFTSEALTRVVREAIDGGA
jgi:CheY-like chemotaxis protein